MLRLNTENKKRSSWAAEWFFCGRAYVDIYSMVHKKLPSSYRRLSFSDHVSESDSVSPKHFHSCLFLNSIQILSTPLIELEDSSYLIILTQVCMMTASIEMKSSESEAPLQGRKVKGTRGVNHVDRR